MRQAVTFKCHRCKAAIHHQVLLSSNHPSSIVRRLRFCSWRCLYQWVTNG